MIKFMLIEESKALLEVKRNGYALRHVKEQSDAICLAAVKRNGYALRYVKEHSEAICLEAVKENGDALQHVLDLELFKSISIKLNIETEFTESIVCSKCGK